jgi:hypothetical protein
LLPAAGAIVFLVVWGAYTLWACVEIFSMTLR